MGYDDRYGNDDRNRDRWRGQGDGHRHHRSGDGDRGFFERASDTVGSWFGGDDDDHREHRQSQGRQERQDHDRDHYRGGSHASYGQGDDHRRGHQYSERDRSYQSGGQGRSSGSGGGFGGGSSGSDSGAQAYGTVGVGSGIDRDSHSIGGLGAAPEFSDGPRFDRQDVGSVGTHGVHPVSSRFGDAQRDPYGAEGGGMGGGTGGGSSARARAILQQAEQHGGRGRIEPGEQASYGQSGRQGQSGQHYYSAGGHQNSRSEHDPHYSQWRQRQIESLDRDYDEYRRENASRFESEFGTWREKRGKQRQSLGRAREHMEVVGSDGQHVGTVDKVAGDRIILTKNDQNAGGHHHSIPCSWIENVDDKVTISKTADQAMAAWRDEETSRALNEDRNSGSGGPHVLERSFSGTYGDDDR